MSFPDRLPRQSEKGSAGAVGMWLEDCRSQALKGTLTHERAEALREAGIDVGKGSSARSEAEQRRRCSFSARAWQRAVLAAAMALWFAAQPLSGAPWHQGCLLCVCGAVMASGVVCDLRARVIPLECCAALLVVGGAYQLLRHGSAGIAEGAVAAAVVLAVCWVANLIARKSGGSVGFGDIRCMTALAFACGPATLLGRGGLLCVGVRVFPCRDVGAPAWSPRWHPHGAVFIRMAGGGDDGARMRTGYGKEVVPLGWLGARFDSVTRKRQRMGRFGYEHEHGYEHERRFPEGFCGQGPRSGVSRRGGWRIGNRAGGYRAWASPLAWGRRSCSCKRRSTRRSRLPAARLRACSRA